MKKLVYLKPDIMLFIDEWGFIGFRTRDWTYDKITDFKGYNVGYITTNIWSNDIPMCDQDVKGIKEKIKARFQLNKYKLMNKIFNHPIESEKDFRLLIYPFGHPFHNFSYEVQTSSPGFIQICRFYSLYRTLQYVQKKEIEHPTKITEIFKIKVDYLNPWKP